MQLNKGKIPKKSVYFLLFLLLLMQLILRIPFLQEPLEGDEGVYASIGQGILAGEVPYRDFFDHKPPVIYYINAFIFKFFGQILLSIRLFAGFFALFGTLGIFWIGNRWWGEKAGLLAAASYALFSGGPLIEGAGSNTESFMVVFIIFALLAYVLAFQSSSRHKGYALLLLAGFFSGLAVMTKQVALLNFFVLLAFSIPYKNFTKIPEWVNAFYLIIGCSIMPIVFAIYFWFNHALSDFINFAFLFNLGYIQSGWNLLLLIRTLYIAFCENSVIWVLSLAAVFYILRFKPAKWNLFLILWALFSFLGTSSGGHYFGHYYIQVIPALCLFSGYALAEIRFKKFWINMFAVLILLFLFILIILNEYEFYLKYSPEEISIAKYGHSYNAIAKKIGQEIKKRTKPGDYVLEIGFPQIHFYSNRRSPGKYYSLARGGSYEIYLFGKKIYDEKFEYRISKNLYDMVSKDLIKGLKNKKTRFVIFHSEVYLPRNFYQELSKYFTYSDGLSEKMGEGILVFERKINSSF